MSTTPPIDLSEENTAYLRGLKPGEHVIECGECCMKGRRGVVYMSESGGGLCVMWDMSEGKMGTSVTHGTRRISDVLA